MRYVLLTLLFASAALAGLAFAETITIGGVAFEDNEVAAYESAVTTQVNEIRKFRAKADDAVRFFSALDPSLFTAQEKTQLLTARNVVRLAAKRQIEALGEELVTPVTVKRELLERAVEDAVGAEAIAAAQGALDTFNADHPE